MTKPDDCFMTPRDRERQDVMRIMEDGRQRAGRVISTMSERPTDEAIQASADWLLELSGIHLPAPASLARVARRAIEQAIERYFPPVSELPPMEGQVGGGLAADHFVQEDVIPANGEGA